MARVWLVIQLYFISRSLRTEDSCEKTVSKSQFKPHALEYLRQVEKTRKPLVITDRGRPVLKLVPYTEDPDEALQELRGSVLKYEAPTEPVGMEEWETLS